MKVYEYVIDFSRSESYSSKILPDIEDFLKKNGYKFFIGMDNDVAMRISILDKPLRPIGDLENILNNNYARLHYVCLQLDKIHNLIDEKEIEHYNKLFENYTKSE